MFDEGAFTLLEAVVATLVGMVLVLSLGLLTEHLEHRRASTDSTSGSLALAELQMERLLTKKNPASDPELTAGLHGPASCVSPPCMVDQTGAPSLNGPYLMQWDVVDNDGTGGSPLVDPTVDTKQIAVTVAHVTDPLARATLRTYYKYR